MKLNDWTRTPQYLAAAKMARLAFEGKVPVQDAADAFYWVPCWPGDSPLQQDGESGDPVRRARVETLAAQIRADMLRALTEGKT